MAQKTQIERSNSVMSSYHLQKFSTKLSKDEKKIVLSMFDDMSRQYGKITDILRHRRYDGSDAEKTIINRYIKSPFREKCSNDLYGNIWIEVDADKSDILWSCHTDTVHKDRDKSPKQNTDLYFHNNRILIGLSEKSRKSGNCLGADDGAGIFLMTEMINAGVPGTYVFHKAEESGCLGSGWIRKHRKSWLSKFKYAIAFDRQDTFEIITHQMYGRTASEEFAESLAEILNAEHKSINYMPSSEGVYTDTNEYADVIPECTNIGVGYEDQHGPIETLDLGHLLRLRKALLNFDESKLICKRDPSIWEDDSYGWQKYMSGGQGFYVNEQERKDAEADEALKDEISILTLIENYPEVAAKIIIDFGYNRHAFLDEVYNMHGKVDSIAFK